MLNSSQITQELIGNMVRDTLRKWVGGKTAGKPYTFAELADLIGASQRTVENWVSGEVGAPDVSAFWRLCQVEKMGPHLLESVLLAVTDRTSLPQSSEDGCTFELNAIVSAAMAVLGWALKDGRVDHTEQPHVIEAVKELHRQSGEYLAAHQKGQA
tara:strand:- start:3078 stop:3545 length:468 start_codon:yes stop_codon:yes gene_type:complete